MSESFRKIWDVAPKEKILPVFYKMREREIQLSKVVSRVISVLEILIEELKEI